VNPLRFASRTAVNGSLRLARWPVDRALHAAGRPPAAEAVIDRLDAAARDIAGLALLNPDLREDARDLRAAAGERDKAARLRQEADLRKQRADELAADERAHAGRQRKQASEQARRRRNQAAEERRTRSAQAAKTEQRRKQAAARTAAAQEEAVDEREDRERLDALRDKAEALEQRDEALTARDEARRLGDAAAAAKAARKGRAG
jgi:colicin import membrane protein